MSNVVFKYLSPTLGSFTIIANFLVLLFMRKTNTKITPSLVYITNLAISDLLVGVIIVLVKLLYCLRINFEDLQASKALNEFYKLSIFTFLRLSLFISVLTLIVVTIDRIVAVHSPLFHRVIKRRVSIIICVCIWIISIVISTMHYCLLKFQIVDENFGELLFPVLVYPTSFVIVLGYLFIILKVKSQRRRMTQIDFQFKNKNQSEEKKILESNLRKSVTLKNQIKKELKLIKLTLLIVVTFLFCWLPWSTYGLVVAINKKSNVAQTKTIEDSLFAMAILNSLINPMVYAQHFRKEFGKYLQNICICCFKASRRQRHLILEESSITTKYTTKRLSNLYIDNI